MHPDAERAEKNEALARSSMDGSAQ